MADIQITSREEGKREVLVNGVSIPDVKDVTLYITRDSCDEVTLTIHADRFRSEL